MRLLKTAHCVSKELPLCDALSKAIVSQQEVLPCVSEEGRAFEPLPCKNSMVAVFSLGKNQKRTTMRRKFERERVKLLRGNGEKANLSMREYRILVYVRSTRSILP